MPSNMTEVAKATVTIIPNMQGAQKTITDELTGGAESAGAAAGKKAGKGFGTELSNTLGGVGKALTKTVTVPVMAIGAASVAAFKEVDAGMDTIVKKTGASGEALEDMETILKNIATTIPTDFATAGEAIGEVNTRFGVTGQDLEDLSTKFIKFAELNDTNVSASVDNVSKALAAFGLDASEAGTMLDALNTVGQNTGVSVDTLAQLMSQNAMSLQEMGLSAYDAAMFLGQVDMAGLDTSTMMTGLRTAMAGAAEDGVSLSDVLSEFSGVMQGNGTEADKLAAAYELFGTRAGGAIANAVENGTLDLTNFGQSIDDFSGSVEESFEATLDPIDSFNTLLNELKILGADIMTVAGPSIESALESVGEVVKSVTEWWGGLNEGTQDFIIKAALVVAALGPVLTTLSALNGWVIVVIAAIAGIIAIITNWGAISEWFAGVWQSVCNWVSNAWDNLKETATNTWKNIKESITNFMTGIKNKITEIWNKIKMKTAEVWEGIKSAITKPIEKAKEKISEIIDRIKEFFSGLKLELPKIKLPHFTIEGEFSLSPLRVPHLAIDWYAKAATEGAIFNTPTIIGVGDAAQPEMLIGQDTLRDMIGSAGTQNITLNVYGAEGQNVRELAHLVMEELQFAVDRKEAAFA